MNREIEFRGMRKCKLKNGMKSNEWVYGHYCKENMGYFNDCWSDSDSYDLAHFIKSTHGDNFKDYIVIPETVGQFTGLVDVTGKKIFEGDIVQQREFKSPLEVIYSEDELGFQMRSIESSMIYSLHYKNIEIIGNIHESEEE